jgi:hypothetical protein
MVSYPTELSTNAMLSSYGMPSSACLAAPCLNGALLADASLAIVEAAAPAPPLSRFWISWWHITSEMGGVWWPIDMSWITGQRGLRKADLQHSICAIVDAESMEDAKRQVDLAYDAVLETPIQFRFCMEKPPNWRPGESRFPTSADGGSRGPLSDATEAEAEAEMKKAP